MFDLKLHDVLTVECRTEDCPHNGVVKVVPIEVVAVDLIAVPPLRCLGCGNAPWEVWSRRELGD